MRIFLLGPFRNAYLFRGLAVWAGLRVALGALEVVELGLPATTLLLLIVGAVVYLDARRRQEDLFLGNVGISGIWIAVAAVLVPMLLEGIIL